MKSNLSKKRQRIPNVTEKQEKITNTKIYLNCRGHASMVLEKLHGALDVTTSVEELTKSIDRIIAGKTCEIEAMLITQAKVLEYVFYDSLKRLYGAEIEHAETYGNIALRAQNQSRKALTALAELKSPRRAIFVKQQNNAINQQVNPTIAKNINDFKNPQKHENELLSEARHETLDFRRTEEAVGINPTMEALENSRS